MNWAFLIAAGLGEIVYAGAMPCTEGVTRLARMACFGLILGGIVGLTLLTLRGDGA